MDDLGSFPEIRMRRLRQSEAIRSLTAETRLSADQFVMPYFVREGRGVREAIDAMPGQFRFSPDTLLGELEELIRAGIKAVLLFGVSGKKDARASMAAAEQGLIQKAVREIKKRFPELLVITDVCLCAYTDHGHCGVLTDSGSVDNDASLEILARSALSHAEAGADIVAPSDMMDGRVKAIRAMLDQSGFEHLPIMSYAAKYASAFYGPFRDAAKSAPGFGDRKSYQMNPANASEAVREAALDIREGADMVMVKPALAYLDVIRAVASAFPAVPVAAYAVSGEYAMIEAAAQKGWADRQAAVMETMTAMARAGARILITYHARQIAGWLQA